jgi:hypothetical protein
VIIPVLDPALPDAAAPPALHVASPAASVVLVEQKKAAAIEVRSPVDPATLVKAYRVAEAKCIARIVRSTNGRVRLKAQPGAQNQHRVEIELRIEPSVLSCLATGSSAQRRPRHKPFHGQTCDRGGASRGGFKS